MNISSENSSITESSSSGSNGTESGIDFQIFSGAYMVYFLFGCPLNFYVIWLIVKGHGNGLASEFFILNLCVCQILLCVQSLMISIAHRFETFWTVVVIFDGIAITGHPAFQCLICVERYLAVVHPVIFMKYKPLRYRLICSAVTWVATFASCGLNALFWLLFPDWLMFFLVSSFLVLISVQMFCCVAVLRVLKQSGPGERGGEREEENHMKRRAFYIIIINSVTIVIISLPYVILAFLAKTKLYYLYMCLCEFCLIFAGLVHPVLFLYRVGKLNFIFKKVCL